MKAGGAEGRGDLPDQTDPTSGNGCSESENNAEGSRSGRAGEEEGVESERVSSGGGE